MQILFATDLHLGHENIHKFRCKSKGFFRDFSDEKEHREWIESEICPRLTKRTILYLLGDICISDGSVDYIKKWPGKRILIKGNHDIESTKRLMEAFDEIFGLHKYKNMWLSHAPVHPNEIRGRPNLHGHVHYATINYPDRDLTYRLPKNQPHEDYLNICPENLMNIVGRPVITLDEVKEYLSEKQKARRALYRAGVIDKDGKPIDIDYS